MLTKDRKPPDGFSDWDSFYEHGAREILPKLERAPCTGCGYHDVCIHATDIEVLKARLVERDATIAKLEAELAPFRARDGARRARMARSADDE